MQSKTINSSIKIVKFFIGLFILATISTGCKKACSNVKCLNGGVCIDGTCKCPGGYSGPNCENYDPCYNITCLNGGTCANGSCNCPIGYGGSDCGIALPLKSVTITRIIVNNFPALKTIGQVRYTWDPGTTSSKYPDIYININAGSTSNTARTSAVYNNIKSPPQTYTIGGVILRNPYSYYTIGLYDDDGVFDSPDFIGAIRFIPANYKSYPPEISLANSEGTIKYLVYVNWNF